MHQTLLKPAGHGNPDKADRLGGHLDELQAIIKEINEQQFGTSRAYHLTVNHYLASTIVRVVFNDPNKNYYLKVKHPQLRLNPNVELTKEGLKREYANLTALNASSINGISMPRPLFCNPDAMVLATSELPGVPFLRKYSRLSRLLGLRRNQMLSSLKEIGKALRVLHELRIDCPTTLPGQYASQFKENIRDSMLPVPRDLLARLYEFSDEIEEKLSQAQPLATCHNDFALHNLVIGPRAIGFLDFDVFARNRREHDFATFYVSLFDFVAWTPLRRSLLERLWREFCRGYGGSIPIEGMKPFLVQYLVNHLLELAVRLDNGSPQMRKLFISRLIRLNSQLLAGLLVDRER